MPSSGFNFSPAYRQPETVDETPAAPAEKKKKKRKQKAPASEPPAKKKMGRPSTIHAQTKKKVLRLLRYGASRADAARACGLHRTTFATKDWVKQDPEFLAAMEAAEAENTLAHIEKIFKEKSWKSSAWWLERRFPERYAQTVKQEHSGKIEGSGPDLSNFTKEELLEIAGEPDEEDGDGEEK